MSTVANNNTPKAALPTEEPTAEKFISPEVNIHENAEGYVLQADLAGVSKAGLDIQVEGNILTLTGRRTKVATSAEPMYRESSESDYRRSFELDPAIDTDKIEGRLDQGVLTVRLPKTERAKSRKVQVSD